MPTPGELCLARMSPRLLAQNVKANQLGNQSREPSLSLRSETPL